MEIVHDRLPEGMELADLGVHELRGLSRPERIFELRRRAPGSGELPGSMREIRKTVTVLFVGLIEAGGDHERPDAEVRRRVSHSLAGVRAVLERHGGTVEEYPGDVLMAVFGVPLLHEDDRPSRASRGRLRRALPSLAGARPERGIGLGARVGAATGEVIAERGSRRAPAPPARP